MVYTDLLLAWNLILQMETRLEVEKVLMLDLLRQMIYVMAQLMEDLIEWLIESLKDRSIAQLTAPLKVCVMV